ncbi:MAG TPA: hypothetical protein VKK61_08015, partial [Tepidisphaeraceae bacterium]|nr:hypothetical protein [Tepidisphaeraceae bacterium]
MQRTRIKFCGITRVEDAQAAAALGADAIGMVLHADTARRIEIEQAKKIMAILPAFVTPVGLFADAPLQTIKDITAKLRLRHIQLYGDDSLELTASLRDFCVIKAIHVARETFGEQLKSLRDSISRLQLHNLKGLLLETASGQ